MPVGSSVPVTLFLVLFLFLASAAISRAQPVQYGLEAGGGYASLDYIDTPDIWRTGGRASFNAMAFTLIGLPGQFSLQTGLRYSQYGVKVAVRFLNPLAGPAGYFRKELHYLSVPFRLQLRAEGQGFYAFVGPEIGYLIRGIGREYPVNAAARTADLLATVHRTNLSMTIGVGHWLRFGDRDVAIQAVFTRGLSRSAKPGQWLADWNPQDIAVTAGWVF